MCRSTQMTKDVDLYIFDAEMLLCVLGFSSF